MFYHYLKNISFGQVLHQGNWLLAAAAEAPAADTMARASVWKDKAIGYLIENGPRLVGAAIIIIVGMIMARWLGALLMHWLSGKDLEPPVRMLITRISKLFVIGFAVVIALGTIGFNIAALVAGISVAGVAVGLAMQGVLGNLVAGLVIIFSKPFRVGEYILLLGVEGQVGTIELFSTTLTHADLSKVVIPNRRIVGEILHNYGTVRQLDLKVGVAYESDISKVLAVLRQVVTQYPKVLKNPVPVIGISELADSSINIAVKPWVNVPDFAVTGPELYRVILDRLVQEQIVVPYPQHEVRLLGGGVPPASR